MKSKCAQDDSMVSSITYVNPIIFFGNISTRGFRDERNFHVVDTCCAAEVSPIDNPSVRLSKLKLVTAPDGIHFHQQGYINIVHSCISGVEHIAHRATIGRQSGQAGRGFCSPYGSDVSGKRGSGQRGGGAWRRPSHPYPR
jgi:hypothetical protein